MKVNAKNLKKAVQFCQHSVGKQSWAQYVQLTAAQSGLRVYCCNLETAHETYIDATVEQDVDVAIPVADLANLLKSASGDIAIIPHQSHVSCEWGSSKYTLPCIPGADMPVMQVPDADPISLSATDLATIQQVVYACGSGDNNAQLAGVHIDMQPDVGILRVITTNAQRLARATLHIDVPQQLAVTLPADLFTATGDIDLYISERTAAICTPGGTIYAQALHGTYPDAQKVIPQRCSSDSYACTELRAAVSRLSNLFGPQASVEIRGTDIRARDEQRQGHEILSHPMPFTAAFSAKYVLDALDHLTDATACITGYEDSEGPITQPLMFFDNATEHVVMPMRMEG